MLSKKLRFIIYLDIYSVFIGGLMSCANNQTTGIEGNTVNYIVTDEVDDASNLKIANTPTVPFWFPE